MSTRDQCDQCDESNEKAEENLYMLAPEIPVEEPDTDLCDLCYDPRSRAF